MGTFGVEMGALAQAGYAPHAAYVAPPQQPYFQQVRSYPLVQHPPAPYMQHNQPIYVDQDAIFQQQRERNALLALQTRQQQMQAREAAEQFLGELEEARELIMAGYGPREQPTPRWVPSVNIEAATQQFNEMIQAPPQRELLDISPIGNPATDQVHEVIGGSVTYDAE